MQTRLPGQIAGAYALQPTLAQLPVRSSSISAAKPAQSAQLDAARKSHAMAWAGDRLRLQGSLPAAQAQLTAALLLDGSNALAHMSLGATLRESGEFAAAEVHLRTALQQRPDNKFTQAQLALTLWQQGRLRLALVYLKQAQRGEPDTALSLTSLATLSYQQGLLKQAQKLFVRSLRLDPGQLFAHARLGDIALRTGHLHAAQIHLERARSVTHQDGFTNARLAEVYRQQGDYPRAIALLAPTTLSSLPDPYALLVLSKATAATGDGEAGLRFAQLALAARPNSADARIQVAACLEDNGRLRQAIELLHPALVNKAARPQVHGALGRLLLKVGQPKLAREHLERALSLSEGSTTLALLRAEATWDIDGAAAALPLYADASARAPTNWLAKHCLNVCQDWDTALTPARQPLASLPLQPTLPLRPAAPLQLQPPQQPQLTAPAQARRINDENAPLQLAAPTRKAASVSQRRSFSPPQMVPAKAAVAPPYLSTDR